MPNWGDDEDRYWWWPIGEQHKAVRIPHAPVAQPKGCKCACCEHARKEEAGGSG